MKDSFHKINEHYLIPILFVLSSMSVIALVYFVNECLHSETYFKSFYGFDATQIAAYKTKMQLFIAALIAVLALKVLTLKYKSWLFSVAIILVNTILLIVLIQQA